MVLAYDAATQCILLQESAGVAGGLPQCAGWFSYVRQWSQSAPSLHPLLGRVLPRVRSPPPGLDLGALQAKEEGAVRKAEEEAALRRAGVSDAALEVFAALAKTLPVAWERTSILVLGDIRIASPYLPHSVTGGSTAARERVKMVLSRERERLNLKP